MHEMSLCESIREVIEAEAAKHGFTRVERIRLEFGRFAGVERAALEFAFGVVMRGSPAEGAMLEMIEQPGRAHCFDCSATVEIEDRFALCPNCGGERLLPEGGGEMRIKDMEVR